MALMESLLEDVRESPNEFAQTNENMQVVWIQSIFLFSLVWSIGANTSEEGRKQFDSLLRRILVNDPPMEVKPYIKAGPVKITQLFPEGRSVYDFTFNKSRYLVKTLLQHVAACTSRSNKMYGAVQRKMGALAGY